MNRVRNVAAKVQHVQSLKIQRRLEMNRVRVFNTATKGDIPEYLEYISESIKIFYVLQKNTCPCTQIDDHEVLLSCKIIHEF